MKEKRTTASRTIITTVALHYTVLVADRIHGGVAGMLIDNCPGNMRSDMASEGERVERRDGFGVKYWQCRVTNRRKREGTECFGGNECLSLFEITNAEK